MNRYAILSKDKTRVENIIIATPEYAEGKELLCCDGIEIEVGWQNIDGHFVDVTPKPTSTISSDYEEINMTDDEISNLLRMIQENETGT